LIRPGELAPIPQANGRLLCRLCNKSMRTAIVLENHHKIMHQGFGAAACTECVWSHPTRPNDLRDHYQTVHDIYATTHHSFYSTTLGHVKRKNMALLRRLLDEERATLAELRGTAAPPIGVPETWTFTQVALEVIRVRNDVKAMPNWRQVVDRKRAQRVVGYWDNN
jgi:hypothetical protein